MLAAISTCGFIDRIIMNVLVQPIKAEFRLSDTEIGLVTGLAFAVLNVVLGIWVARIAERRRRITLIGIGTFFWSIATAACGTATSFVTSALARVGVGVGEAVGLPASQSVISDYFPRHKRTTAMAVLLLAPPLGAFLGSAGGATIAQAYGWRAAFVAASIPGFILALVVLLTVAEPPRGQHDDLEDESVPPYRAVLARMWQRHAFRHLLAGSTIASMVGFGLNAFLAAFLFRKFGYSVRDAGIIAGLIASLPATLGVLGAGWLADRMARLDARAYGTIPGVSLLLATPIYILAVTRDDSADGDRPARARRDGAILLPRAVAGRVPESDAPPHARFLIRDRADLLFDHRRRARSFDGRRPQRSFRARRKRSGFERGADLGSRRHRDRLFVGLASFLPGAAADQGGNEPAPCNEKGHEKGPLPRAGGALVNG